MRLLIDVGAIKTGGGAQLAINFLDWLQNHADEVDVEGVAILLPELGPLSNFTSDNPLILGAITYPNNYIKRKLFEIKELPSFLLKNKITHIFTFFGAGLPRYPNIKTLVSVAYPIICYPESPFWATFPLKNSIRQKILNFFRRARIRSADCVLVETEVMKSRLIRNVGVSEAKLVVYPPVPSAYIDDMPYLDKDHEITNFLFLSGLDHHKNLWRLPEIAKNLSNMGFDNFKFSLSVNKDAYIKLYRSYVDAAGEKILDRHFDFLGSIPSREINDAYKGANFLVNISDLESFSNNYMEAWKAGIPLICSDTDFAKEICKDSAIYIPQHNSEAAAAMIIGYVRNQELKKRNVDSGKTLLSEMPILSQRVKFLTDLLRKL